jgi:hypothetical protein
MMSSDYARAQSGSPEILDRTIEMHIKNGTLLQALSTLAVFNGIPIGLESCLPYRDEYDLNLDVNAASLKDLLDKIVQQRPDYRWEARDGVINILPVKSKDELVNRLLSTRIQRFAPQKGLNQFGLRDAIIALPEVQSFLKDNMMTASRYGYFYHPDPHLSQIDSSSSEVELRQVLNKVVRDSNYKIWIVSRSGVKLEYLDIFL